MIGIQNYNLFKDLTAFDIEVIPTELLFRTKEIEILINNFAPLQIGFKPITNAVIYGQPSIGKTSVAKKILEIFREEATSKVITCYIDLAIHQTNADIAEEMYSQVTKHNGRNRISKCFEGIFQTLKNKGMSLLIVLDDFTAFGGKDINIIIQTLIRPIVKYKNVHVGIILVSSGDDYVLRNRIRNILGPSEYKFRNYNDDEKFEILKKRCIQGFNRFVITDKLITEVVERSTDLRHGLRILVYSGNIANKKITKKDIDTSFEVLKGIPKKEKQLNELETFLLLKIKDSSNNITTGDLYQYYKKEKGNITIQGIGKSLKKLKILGVIDYKFITGKEILGSGRGRTRVWYLI